MFGKHFASMYAGSMVGSGAIVFAVMGYVISNQEPDRVVGSQVDLNPRILAAVLGESVTDVERAIDHLCRPDKNSRTKDEDGKRLVKIGTFTYRVVNGAKYREIRNMEDRRAYNRLAKQAERTRRKAGIKGRPLPGENSYCAAAAAGASELILGRMADPRN